MRSSARTRAESRNPKIELVTLGWRIQRREREAIRTVILSEAKDLRSCSYLVESRETAVILRFAQDDRRLIFSRLPFM